MFLNQKNLFVAGICLILTAQSVYPFKDNIQLLFKILNNETQTNPLNCNEKESVCEKTITNPMDTMISKSPIEILKALYIPNENTQERKVETTKEITTQFVNETINMDDMVLTTTAIINNGKLNETTTTTTTEKSVKVPINEENTVDSISDSPKTDNETSSLDEINLTELIPLSGNGGEETGQTIELQRSNVNSDFESTNEAGVEILKNTSQVCGSLLGKRISFANITTLMEFPWTALLLYNTKERYHCGGSLITTKYVLTAAHCVAQQFYELTGVRLGEHDVAKERDCEPDIVGQDICTTTVDAKVLKIIVHHGYSHLSFKNDIALLRLDQSYYSRSFYPICIPTPDKTFTDTKAIVAGWGATEKAVRSTVLRKAEVPILDMSACRSIYRYSKFNDTTEICGSGVNEVDVCQGDSGGALFYNENVANKQKYYQLGIISLGVRRCGDKRFLPAVFTKLTGYYKWIENNLEY